jgi:hypothetical protein
VIVTAEMLARYRSLRAPAVVGGLEPTVVQLPGEFFTDTADAFKADWDNVEGISDYEVAREKLEIVLMLAFTQIVPALKPGREWLGLDHQYGGYACRHRRMIATRLNPHRAVVSMMRQIARDGWYGEDGHFYEPTDSRVSWYTTALSNIDVRCKNTWTHLAESLYPIDATQENLDRVAEDAPILESIADWEGIEQAGLSSDPVILFLTMNSD